MCLTTNKSVAPAEFPKQFYKVYLVKFEKEGLYSPLYYWAPGGSVSGPGTKVSSRHNSARVDDERGYEVGAGFHVFLHEKDAKRYAQGLGEPSNGKTVVVKVHCLEEDLVAWGWTQVVYSNLVSAVFTKITITQEEWDRIFPCV